MYRLFYRDNLNCKLGCLEEDTLNQCMICTVIDNQIGKTSARMYAILLVPEKNQQAVSIFMKRKSVRTAILEGRTANHGQTILDASTLASVGGAGERIGIPYINPNPVPMRIK